MTNKNELSEIVKTALQDKLEDLYSELENYEDRLATAGVALAEAEKEKSRWQELVDYKRRQMAEIEEVLG